MYGETRQSLWKRVAFPNRGFATNGM
jgi:hypothetical protein